MIDSARPQYVPPALGRDSPGYNWREQRAQDDWRNNTWRENREQNDWRNNTWREQRANEDWQQREDYAKDRTKNNATDRGYVECGVGSVGSSMPCRDYAKDKTKSNERTRGYVECSANSVVETCRSRDDSSSAPLPEQAERTQRAKPDEEKKE
jgi:hypothetical protein